MFWDASKGSHIEHQTTISHNPDRHNLNIVLAMMANPGDGNGAVGTCFDDPCHCLPFFK